MKGILNPTDKLWQTFRKHINCHLKCKIYSCCETPTLHLTVSKQRRENLTRLHVCTLRHLVFMKENKMHVKQGYINKYRQLHRSIHSIVHITQTQSPYIPIDSYSPCCPTHGFRCGQINCEAKALVQELHSLESILSLCINLHNRYP